jgi:hypothetical protein
MNDARTPDGLDLSPDDALTARYLDGLLEGDELAAFERRLQKDVALRTSVELDRRMVDSLRTSLAPLGVWSAPAPIPVARGKRSKVGLAIAAGLAIVVSAAALWYQHASISQLPQTAARTPIQIYANEVGGGFAPDWVCSDDAEMLRFTRERFGAGLLFVDRPGVALVGWGYAEGTISDLTATLLVRAGDDRIVLLVDRKSNDRRIADPAASDPSLHMFRREVGPYVLYEITPLDTPVASSLAYAVADDVQLGPGEKGSRGGVRPTGPKPPPKGGN